jgi:hypothetical protein
MILTDNETKVDLLNKAVTDNLVHGYGSRVPGYYNIKVLHTALEGNVAHANYALSEASGDPILMRLVDD